MFDLPAARFSNNSKLSLFDCTGHVADGLQTSPPDVYVSSDGGYSWSKVRHYRMQSSGFSLTSFSKQTLICK
jgi:hypothetical protein